MGAQPNEQPRIYRRDEQEVVLFHGHPIIAVRLDDGRIAVVLRSLCEGMGLNTQAQVRRAERTEALAGALVSPWLETHIGLQELPALILEVLPGWLTGVDTRRVQGEAHDTILAYQREAYGVLYQHFVARSHPALPLPQVSAIADPALAAQVAALVEQIETQQAVLNLMQEHLAALLALPGQVAGVAEQVSETRALLETLAERQGDTDARLAAVDARTDHLTREHAKDVRELVDRIVRETKRLPTPLTHEMLYGRLKHRFRANSYTRIPDNRYEELLSWLRDALTRATSGAAPQQGELF
jgi:hypothetical protein